MFKKNNLIMKYYFFILNDNKNTKYYRDYGVF